MTNWYRATHPLVAALQRIIDSVQCPHCGECNSETHHQIEIENGRAVCNTCSYSWQLSEGDFT